MPLRLILRLDRRLERFLGLRRRELAAYGGQHPGRLLPAHHRDAGVRPHEQEPRIIGAAAHAVIPGAIAAADNQGQLGHLGGGHGGHQLGAVFRDAAGFVLPPDHEAGDVLQEQQRDVALAAQLDEMRALQRGLAEQDAVIGHDPDGHAVQMREAADQRGAIEALELIEFAAIDQPRDHLPHVIGIAHVAGDDAIQLRRVVMRFGRRFQRQRRALAPVQARHDAAADRQGMPIIAGVMVDDAGGAGVDVRAAEVLGRDDLPGRGLHQRRAAEEDGPLLADDDALIGHRRDISAAGGAAAHDDGDLGNAFGRHIGLIEEDAAEMFAVREDLVLHRQEGATGIHQIDAGQIVLACDLLRAEVLFDRHRKIGAAFDRGVVGNDHTFLALHPANAGDDPGRWHVAAVQPMRGELGELQKRRTRIDQPGHPFPRQQLTPGKMALPRSFAAATLRRLDVGPQIGRQCPHRGGIGGEFFRAGVEVGAQHAGLSGYDDGRGVSPGAGGGKVAGVLSHTHPRPVSRSRTRPPAAVRRWRCRTEPRSCHPPAPPIASRPRHQRHRPAQRARHCGGRKR